MQKYNQTMRLKKRTPIYKRKLVIATIVTVLATAGILVLLEKKQVINLYTTKDAPAAVEEAAVTTSTAPSAQDDFNEGGERQEGNSLSEGEGTGSVDDNQGVISEETSPSNWITSKTGEITLYSPVANKKVSNNAEISGSSTLGKVSFRLIDSISGVIAQGDIQVVNGKFSGKLNYITSASEGRLDIFATKNDGQEYSNVEVPIKF